MNVEVLWVDGPQRPVPAPELARAYGRLVADYIFAHGDDMGDDYHARSLRSETTDGTIRLVARHGTDIIGCIAVALLDEPPRHRAYLDDPDARPQPTAEVRHLWVDPKHRGKRAGQALVAYALDVARNQGAKRVVLTTSQTMAPAQSLYRSVGFREAAPDPNSDQAAACRQPVHFELDLAQQPSSPTARLPERNA